VLDEVDVLGASDVRTSRLPPIASTSASIVGKRAAGGFSTERMMVAATFGGRSTSSPIARGTTARIWPTMATEPCATDQGMVPLKSS
jgi:hypothetical protein